MVFRKIIFLVLIPISNTHIHALIAFSSSLNIKLHFIGFSFSRSRSLFLLLSNGVKNMILMNRNRMGLSEIVVKAIQTAAAAVKNQWSFQSLKCISHEIYQLILVTQRTVKIMMLIPSTQKCHNIMQTVASKTKEKKRFN